MAKMEMYDTVKITKGFFQGAQGVIIKIKDDEYIVDVRGAEINKKKNEVKKL